MIDEKKLKPCPFCGGEAEVVEFHDILDDSDKVYVACTQCRAQTQEIYTSVRIFGNIPQSLSPFEVIIVAWNRRVGEHK